MFSAKVRRRQEIRTPNYIPELDGLRAFAILSVLFSHMPLYWLTRHAGPATFFHHGWVGVDLFFVLSGFLITGILLDARTEPHYYRNFYARRALRIWPLYYLVLVFALFVYPALQPHFRPLVMQYPWRWYFLYVQNFAYGLEGIPLLTVTWSLAVEEQFYIVWPGVVRRMSSRSFRNLLIGMLVAAPLLRLLMLSTGQGWTTIATSTFTRMDGIVAGALLAWWMRSGDCTPAKLRRLGWIGIALGAPASIFLLGWHEASMWTFTALAFAFTGVLALTLAARAAAPIPCRILSSSPMRYTGKISYGLYLIHPIAFIAAAPLGRALHLWPQAATTANDVLTSIVRVAFLFAIASVSWFVFESRLLKLKSRFTGEPAAKEVPARAEVAVAASC